MSVFCSEPPELPEQAQILSNQIDLKHFLIMDNNGETNAAMMHNREQRTMANNVN